MWLGLITSLVLLYPAIEMIEDWRIYRSAERDLVEMRKHAACHDRWDATRGQWVASTIFAEIQSGETAKKNDDVNGVS